MSLIEKIDRLSMTICDPETQDELISKAEVKQFILSEQKEPCEWTLSDEDSNSWQCSKCDALWNLESGSPQDNDMHYCPQCGSPISQPSTDAS